MPSNAENHQHGDCSVPDIPDSSLPEPEYFAEVIQSLEGILSRFGAGTATEVEVATTIMAFIAEVSTADVYDFDAQGELTPWFQRLANEVRQFESAKRRGGEFFQEDTNDATIHSVSDDEDNPRESPVPSKKHGRGGRGLDPSPSDSSSSSGGSPDSERGPKRRRAPSGDSDNGEEQDELLFGWAPAALLKEVQLTPEQKLIRKLVENHKLDIKGAKDSLLRSGAAPVFPDALWKKVLLDEVVDFDEINAFFFSTKLELDPAPLGAAETTLQQALGRRADKKTVSSCVSWFRCFDKYSKAVATVFPFRRDELSVWREHIDGLFTAKKLRSHGRVIAYDIAARKIIASNPAILFDQPEAPEIVAQRPAFLERDGVRYDDFDGEEEPEPVKPKKSKSSRRKEICHNWNEGRCTRSPCSRQHICVKCGGSHAATACKSKSD